MPQVSKTKLPPINTDEAIGKRLSRLRKERGLTQEAVAQSIGINQVLISKYEREILKLSAEMLFRFSRALNVSADEILGITNNYPSKTPSLKLMKRLYHIEKMTPSQQKVLLMNIDMFLKAAEKE